MLLHFVAHGAFFTAEGEVVEPTLADIDHTQTHVIRQLQARPNAAAVNGGVIFASVTDELIARAIFIDELLAATRPPEQARLAQLSGAMRNHYLFEVRGQAPPALGQAWHQGVDERTAALLEAEGLELLTIIESSGAEYVQECRDAGVPVPDTVMDRVTAPKEVRNPDLTTFNLLADVGDVDELDLAQIWTARQRIGGGPWSQVSQQVMPLDPFVVYPSGLPAPNIVPTPVYDCGQTIAVTHVPGATLYVDRTAGTDFESRGLAGGWTVARALTPFDAYESLSVTQSLCGEESPSSPGVQVGPEPPIPFAPFVSTLYEEQQLIYLSRLVHGSTQELTSIIDGPFASLSSWPTSGREVDAAAYLGRPLLLGERHRTQQGLCDGSVTGLFSDPALACSSLPIAEIVPPVGGDREVVVIGVGVPGSTIRVWGGGAEIGDSSTADPKSVPGFRGRR